MTGPEAIKQFWESQIKAGAKDHTFEMIETEADSKYACQATKSSVQFDAKAGTKTLISGYTVRVSERQSDGT